MFLFILCFISVILLLSHSKLSHYWDRLISNPEIYKICNPIVLGDINVLKKAVDLLNIKLNPKKINFLKDACFKLGQPDILSLSEINTDRLIAGVSTLENGKAMLSYINKGIGLAMNKEIDGIKVIYSTPSLWLQ